MAITQINDLPEIPTLGDPNFSAKMFALSSALKNDFVPSANLANGEIEEIKQDIDTKYTEIEADANRAAYSLSQAQAAATAATNAISASQTAQNAAENARDAAILAASEVGALEVAKMQSYNKQQAMADFDLSIDWDGY